MRPRATACTNWSGGPSWPSYDEDFAPDDDARFDLRKPSELGAELVEELAEFCDLDADLDVLDGPNIDRDDWRTLVDEVRTCLELQD